MARRAKALGAYREKRDFARTTEPRGRGGGGAGGRLYVVQKHAARRLHFDFRLELDGALKSWAVPKGPSADPSERRLAVEVEDHPVDYGSFEGVIPAPGYGAGTVMLWDRGRWTPEGDPEEGYRRGRLKFSLEGQRLRGRWALVRMRGTEDDGKNWLLIKEGREPGLEGEPVQDFQKSVATGRTFDQISSAAPPAAPEKRGRRPAPAPAPAREARSAPMPRAFRPQLATLVERAPAGPGWLHEIKFDGYRILCFLDGGKARLTTRNGQDWTDRFPSVARAAEELRVRSALIDGEVVVQRDDGTSDFQALQNHLKGGPRKPLKYMVFDLAYLDGRDLTGAPLRERKDALRELVSKAGAEGARVVRFSEHLKGRGQAAYASACGHALEGIISKRAESPYRPGERSRDWVKVKCVHQQEFVIGGYTDPQGARQRFGSLLIGTYDGGRLVYNGHVGTGFSGDTLEAVSRELRKRARKGSPFAGPVEDKLRRVVHWVAPDLVCEVAFIGWTEEGYCRHPSFLGLREDKAPPEVHRETAASADRPEGDAVAGVRLTHPDRVLYPAQKAAKRDLALYYQKAAPWILPHLRGRPVTLVRCPEGAGRACFYQKHPVDAPSALRRISIEEKEKKSDYLLVDDAPGLISLVQMSALEVHVWGSTEEDLERPDRLVFDLDPGPDVPWENVVLAARRLKDRLEALGWKSFVKTTGGKGLHVTVPVLPRLGWDAAKALTKGVAGILAQDHPGEYVVKSAKALRPGKIFIDYLRNGRGATSVCPYSTRAKPGAPVAAPLRWDELSPKTDPARFTMESMSARLAGLRHDPWEGFFALKQDVPAEVEKSLTREPAALL